MSESALLAGLTSRVVHDHLVQIFNGEVSVKLPECWQRTQGLHLHESVASLGQLGSHLSVDNVYCAVRNCREAKLLAPARSAHAHICGMGLEADGMLGNQLVLMFMECGSMEDAERVFLVLLCPDDNMLSSLIEEYLQLGESLHAVHLFLKRQDDIYLERNACLMLLKACANIKSIELSQKMHESMIKEGLENDSFVSHTLIDAYGKCGLLLEAREVFDSLLVRNVVSWTALIGAHANQGCDEEALSCLEQMQLEGLSENALTFVCALKACSNSRALNKGRELHNELIKRSIEDNVFAGNSLVDMYLKCGLFAEAWETFNQLHSRNVFSWTALMAGCTENGLNVEALECLGRMQGEGVFPNVVTYKCCLKACAKAGAVDNGQQLHMDLAKQGLDAIADVKNFLIDFYCKCGLLPEAKAVFDKLLIRNVVTWNILIAGYTDFGLGDEALKCLGQMELEGISPVVSTFLSCLKACNSLRDICKGLEIHCRITKMGYLGDLYIGNALVAMYARCCSLVEARFLFDYFGPHDVALWTAVIAAYTDEGESNEAIYLYAQMQEQGLCPNIVTFVTLLKLCGRAGLLRFGRYIHAQTCNVDSAELTDITLETAIMDMYIKCGSMAEASAVFKGASNRNLVRCSTLITRYAHYGEQKHLYSLLDDMLRQGIEPDEVLLLSILTVCNHAGLADEGLGLLECLSQTCKITLGIDHFNCLVDLLSRLGRLDEAMAMLKEMPFSPNSITWNTLVNACRKWGNAGFGRFAFRKMVFSDEECSGAYVLMSNMWVDTSHAARL